MQKIIIAIVAALLLIGIGWYFLRPGPETAKIAPDIVPDTENVPATTTPEVVPEAVVDDTKTVIGSSAGGKLITAYHFGTGEKELLFVGGVHGGYGWNTVLVAYEMMDYLAANPSIIPETVRVTVIPALNPDGLEKVVGTSSKFAAADAPTSLAEITPGRFNGNNVDLNRNFDCDWQATGTWQNTPVSGGAAAFSEPESQAIKNYVESKKPTAVVVWYSASGGVFASNCHGGVLPETSVLTNEYASAAGYTASEDFDFYEVTGDMVNWLAKNNIPAISVLLTNHTDTEWTKNKAGIDAMLKHYAQ